MFDFEAKVELWTTLLIFVLSTLFYIAVSVGLLHLFNYFADFIGIKPFEITALHILFSAIFLAIVMKRESFAHRELLKSANTELRNIKIDLYDVNRKLEQLNFTASDIEHHIR